MANAFDTLEIDVRYDVDHQIVQKHYHNLITKWHPDRVASPLEKGVATKKSHILNDAYQRLLHPLHRADEVMVAKVWQVREPSSDFLAWMLEQDASSFQNEWNKLRSAFAQAVLENDSEEAGQLYGRMRYIYKHLQEGGL